MGDEQLNAEHDMASIVFARLAAADGAHDAEHVKRVVALARHISRREGANIRITIPAAYFHDCVSRREVADHDEHVVRSAECAVTHLTELMYSHSEIDQIHHAIIASAYESALRGIVPTTLEAQVVRDADWLDAIGARGIARACYFGGAYGLKIGDVQFDGDPPAASQSGVCQEQPNTVIRHFFVKLLRIKEELCTQTARSIAESRHQVLVDFLKAFRDETLSPPFEAQ
jgi:uncharacterized protein